MNRLSAASLPVYRSCVPSTQVLVEEWSSWQQLMCRRCSYSWVTGLEPWWLQVIIKMKDVEPEQLGPEIVAAISQVLSNQR